MEETSDIIFGSMRHVLYQRSELDRQQVRISELWNRINTKKMDGYMETTHLGTGI
jgi:hypothetical protein